MPAMHPHRPSFPWKAAAPSLALAGVLLAVTVCATSVLFVSYRASDEALSRAAEALDAAVELEQIVTAMRSNLDAYFNSGDESKLAEVNAQTDDVVRLLRSYRAFITADGTVVFSQVDRAIGNLNQQLDQLQSSPQPERRADARLTIEAILRNDLLNYVSGERALIQSELESARIDSRNMTTIAGWMLLALGLSGAGAGVYAGYSRARALQQQMVELTVSVNTATGSLDDVDEQFDPVAIEPSGDLSQVQSMVDLLVERVSGVVKRLQEAERESIRRDQLASLGQLAAGLAHELRNPLTAIKTLVEAARGSGSGSSLDERDLQVIEEELARLDLTLQSFLDYARPPQSARRAIDVRQLIQNTLHLLSSQMERLSIRVERDLPVDPVRVTADPEQLKQVLLNLCLNAIDAMGDGGTLTVTLHTPSAGGTIEIDVEDTGPGISTAVRERMFEPFVSSKPSGTGLGLTISRRIVEGHGGTISAANRTPCGARFRIKLPVDGNRAGVLEAERSNVPTHSASATSRPLKTSQT